MIINIDLQVGIPWFYSQCSRVVLRDYVTPTANYLGSGLRLFVPKRGFNN